jgi:hypothetical protein
MKRDQGAGNCWITFVILVIPVFFLTATTRKSDLPVDSETPTETPTSVATLPSETQTPLEVPTDAIPPTATASKTQAAPALVLISEVAWAGTTNSSADEWIELWNPGAIPVDLTGWTLSDGGDIHILLGRTIEPGGYLLMERTDDTSVADVTADGIYSGALSNSGETLSLADASGQLIDQVAASAGWPAGNATSYASMERTGQGPYWCTNDGLHQNGLDAAGQPVHGTPRKPFSGFCASTPAPSATRTPTATRTATATPTATGMETQTASPTEISSPMGTPLDSMTPSPTQTSYPMRQVWISEVGWAGTRASAEDEWVELQNFGDTAIDLAGWMLTDGGDIHVALQGVIAPGGYFLLERTSDASIADIVADQIYSGALGNAGEFLQLIDLAGNVVDRAGGVPWLAGSASPTFASMERTAGGGWCTNDGIHRNGTDAAGNPVNGTPRQSFSGFCAPVPPTATVTRTKTQTQTNTPTFVLAPYAAFALIINEIAWGGTTADSSDEWIELWNPGAAPIPLAGWRLTDGDRFSVALSGVIEASGYFLLERGDDSAIRDLSAEQSFEGVLENGGMTLRLIDPTGHVVDSANSTGGAWPAGNGSPTYLSMERASIDPETWASNNVFHRNGMDAEGNPIHGTPRQANSATFAIPTPTTLPRGLLVNEFLPKPGSDWNADGKPNLGDEFIEIFNAGDATVDLGGWFLDDQIQGGSRPYRIPDGELIRPKGLRVFFRAQTKISLGDTADGVWLIAPNGKAVDGINYSRTRWPDSAWGRYPEGVGGLRLGFPPTPGLPNRLPPDLENPKPKLKTEIPAGWRKMDCLEALRFPVLVGDGMLTTGADHALSMAERWGWMYSQKGDCYAWSGNLRAGLTAKEVWKTGYEIGNGYWWALVLLR